MMYKDWKAERQAAMDARTPTLLDAAYKRANLNDSFYYGLESQIEKRQQAKIPIAGEGAVAFFSGLSDVLRWGSKVVPLFAPVAALSKLTEEVAREKSGIYD
jgi:hypothetical protein